ncbi:MAG: hypothetical protein J0I07_08690 [Myxococcales bacterium]|nr:hypothetical protein [Myxococcales bacterium]
MDEDSVDRAGGVVSGGGCASTGAPLSFGGAVLVAVGALLLRRRRAA